MTNVWTPSPPSNVFTVNDWHTLSALDLLGNVGTGGAVVASLYMFVWYGTGARVFSKNKLC